MVKKLLMKKFPDYLGELEEMGKKNHDNTVFMNYVRADDLFKKQKEIVSECIEYDKKHI